MAFLFRRLLRPLIITTIVGFLVRRLMASEDMRMQRIGRGANRFMGHPFGPEEQPHPHRGRRLAKTATTAAVGGAMEYFFDPIQGADRRARVKRFASDKLHRNGHGPILLPESNTVQGTVPTQAMAPGLPA
jgi:hypothetical protein